jgi:hypothetical protein
MFQVKRNFALFQFNLISPFMKQDHYEMLLLINWPPATIRRKGHFCMNGAAQNAFLHTYLL